MTTPELKTNKERATAKIFCCACRSEVEARLTDGTEVYPHRGDLSGLPFWKCDACGNWVGCHHKTKERTKPLGVIPSPEMKNARKHIHAQLDPIWEGKYMKRGQVYARLSEVLGRQYHTAELRTIDEARTIYSAVMKLRREVVPPWC